MTDARKATVQPAETADDWTMMLTMVTDEIALQRLARGERDLADLWPKMSAAAKSAARKLGADPNRRAHLRVRR